MKEEFEAFITDIDKVEKKVTVIALTEDGMASYNWIPISFLEKEGAKAEVGNIFTLTVYKQDGVEKGKILPLEKSVVTIKNGFLPCGSILKQDDIDKLLSFQKKFNEKPGGI